MFIKGKCFYLRLPEMKYYKQPFWSIFPHNASIGSETCAESLH